MPSSKIKKQAVVVIHGIGEQRPMDTVRNFVKRVWKDADDANHFWSKPTTVQHSFEQRRLTTNNIQHGVRKGSRIDFYEYYWAQHTANSRWEQVKGWFFTLLWRNPCRVMVLPHIRGIWLLAWLVILGAAMWAYCFSSPTPFWSLGGLVILVLPFVQNLTTKYLGDVARYVRPTPANIRTRQAIRSDGVALLKRLSQSGDYDRIVLVGHSLGSVIAYDLLAQLWSQLYKFKDKDGNSIPLDHAIQSSVEQLQDYAQQMANGDNAAQAKYWQLQQKLFGDLAAWQNAQDNLPCPWLISDLITLGSPLTYADFLLYPTKDAFRLRQLDKELPTSPPTSDDPFTDSYQPSFTFEQSGERYFHHGAVFAPVRWSNLYSPSRFLLFGDVISGPLATRFASADSAYPTLAEPAIEDIPVMSASSCSERGLLASLFTHRDYWRDQQALEKLRQALNLTPEGEA